MKPILIKKSGINKYQYEIKTICNIALIGIVSFSFVQKNCFFVRDIFRSQKPCLTQIMH